MVPTIPSQRATTSERVLSFASDISVGTLLVRPSGGDPDAGGWERLGEARWSVLIPAGMDVRLWVEPANALRSIPALGAVPADSLTELVLLDSPVEDDHVHHLVGLASLRLLDLFHAEVTDDACDVVAALTSLEWLSFTGTRVGDRGVERLASLTALQRLSLKDTDITDEAAEMLATLPSLHWLSVSGTQITDAGLRALASSTSLRALSVHGTAVTPRAVESTRLGHPSLALIVH